MRRALPTVAGVLLAMTCAMPLARADDDMSSLQEIFAAAVKRVAPSIVSIEVEWKPGKAMIPAAPPARPAFLRGTGPFSGVIISADGLIATSDINVSASDVQSARVKLTDGRSFDAKILGCDVTRGIQLLKIDATELPVPEFAENGQVKVGRWALACGAASDGTPTVSVGIVSATDRIQGRAIQFDASADPTNYGGPLIDIQGRLMGVITPLTTSGTRAGVTLYDSGVGFAVPINDIMTQLSRLKAGETIQAAFLGITFDFTKTSGGAHVVSIFPNTAAEKAGIQAGDVITHFNGEEIHAPFKLSYVIGKCRVGDKVTFKVLRKGKTMDLTATLTAMPEGVQ